MTRPIIYGSLSESWFQYISLAIFFVTMVYLTKKYRKANEEDLQRLLKVFAIILIVFELYKQLNFTYTNGWVYRWYAFPFQFCSTPMYIALAASYMKKTPLRDAMYMFLATFGFFAGTAVMLYPVTVYTTSFGINIQTMIHHGGMGIIGMVLLSHHVSLHIKSFLNSIYVFVGLTLIAIVLNGIHNTWIQDGTFNMFFINANYKSEIPVLSLFQPLVPRSVYIMIFVIGFSVVAYLMLTGRRIVKKLLNT
ncbi:MAG: hypothetical protein ACPF9F_01720 [Acholeplasmataceae bacterium]